MIKDKFPLDLQLEIKKIATLLSPYTKRAYLVGGCVRDAMLANKTEDLDIEVYDIAPNEFDELMKKNGALGVGKSFFVYKLGAVDLSLPRVEQKVGIGHKAFEVEVTDDEKVASKRRDFSMNSMMINIFTGEFLDFWGAMKSIDRKKISLIDENSFKEDSLRVLRAVQFSARFGFKIEDKTLDVMQSIDLSDLTKPRIFWELEKLFVAKHLDLGFDYMYRLGLFEKLFTCRIDFRDIEKVKIKLRQINFVKELRAYYFFYIVANMCGFSPYEWLKKLEAPNQYLRIFKYQPFIDEDLSDKELLKIAIDLPIKKWLGNYRKGVVKQAKKLVIYESVFTGGVVVAQVIEDGFLKEGIKKEYRRRVLEKIDE